VSRDSNQLFKDAVQKCIERRKASGKDTHEHENKIKILPRHVIRLVFDKAFALNAVNPNPDKMKFLSSFTLKQEEPYEKS